MSMTILAIAAGPIRSGDLLCVPDTDAPEDGDSDLPLVIPVSSDSVGKSAVIGIAMTDAQPGDKLRVMVSR